MRPDLTVHAALGLVALAERHFPLLPTASFQRSLGTSVASVHVMTQLKLIEIMLEDDRVSSSAMEDACSWCWSCCLCGNFEFEGTICVHKQ